MKKLLLILMTLLPIIAWAQKDSIAVSQMKQLGVYYFDGNNFKQILPIVPELGKVSVGVLRASTSYEYLGEESENKLNNSIELYIYIPSMYSNQINVKQFRLVKLDTKKGKRKLKTGSVVLFSGKIGTNNTTLDINKINEECYKIFTSGPVEEGHYAVFYNYGNGLPGKLYDFDIVNK